MKEQRRKIFPLSIRIALIGLIGPILLMIGVLSLTGHRDRLIAARLDALRTQGSVIAAAISANAISATGSSFDPRIANSVVRALAPSTGTRFRIYDGAGRLTGDTRSLFRSLPLGVSPEESESYLLLEWLDRLVVSIQKLVQQLQSEERNQIYYRETVDTGVAREESVFLTLTSGRAVQTVSINDVGATIISVTLPLRRYQSVLGALVVSTEEGDIDMIIKGERRELLQIFLIALLVSVVSSLILASTIARPIRMLAKAAEKGVGENKGGSVDPSRIAIPDFSSRSDEIGYLSKTLENMTKALYARIEAIESFAADVAHEIKNPLTSLRSAVETLRKKPAKADKANLMSVIEHDIARMDRLVTDISNASRLDAELVRSQKAPFDIVAQLRTLATIAADRAENRNIKVIVYAPEHPTMINGLESRIGQVFQNLIENAISFSDCSGEVRIEISKKVAHKKMRVRIMVEDDGSGLPDNVGDKIFERFYSERQPSEGFGGHSGLGLAIARQIVHAHGGYIWADTSYKQGARFVIELP